MFWNMLQNYQSHIKSRNQFPEGLLFASQKLAVTTGDQRYCALQFLLIITWGKFKYTILLVVATEYPKTLHFAVTRMISGGSQFISTLFHPLGQW
jgi:hypothetical protein